MTTALALAVLWGATAIIALAQTLQIATILRTRRAAGISLASEGVNAGASLGLLVYAGYLADAPLVAARAVLLVFWLARLLVARRYQEAP